MKKETVRTATTVVAGFGLAFLVIGTSPSFQACIHEHQYHAGGGPLDENVSRLLIFYKIGRGCGGEWLHKHGEAVIALFTIILGIATWLLWRSTKKLVEGADRTAERQLRAYVFIEGGAFELSKNDTKLRVFAKFKNYGQTPAYHARTWTQVQLLPKDSVPFDHIGVEPSEAVIGPGTEIELRFTEPITAQQVADIRAGNQRLFFWGKIDYTDAFDNGHFFEFRCVNSKSEFRPGSWSIEPHESGYKAD